MLQLHIDSGAVRMAEVLPIFIGHGQHKSRASEST